MTEKDQKTIATQLSIVGALELASFISIAVWLVLSGAASGLTVFYFLGGVTLVPSAIRFILAVKNFDESKLQSARQTQYFLFICVCIAFLPALFFAFAYPQFLIACFLGLLFFAVVSGLIPKPGAESRQSAATETDAGEQVATFTVGSQAAVGKFCATCGSPLDTSGSCPKCV